MKGRIILPRFFFIKGENVFSDEPSFMQCLQLKIKSEKVKKKEQKEQKSTKGKKKAQKGKKKNKKKKNEKKATCGVTQQQNMGGS